MAAAQNGNVEDTEHVLPDVAEGTGLEPVRGCPQRFSRPPPYQLGLALPTMLRLNLQRRVLPEESHCLPFVCR